MKFSGSGTTAKNQKLNLEEEDLCGGKDLGKLSCKTEPRLKLAKDQRLQICFIAYTKTYVIVHLNPY